MNQLLGWPIFWSALGVACVSITYVTAGGQTSVIMTDLFQGVMLLATGLVILWLGADYLGGLDQLWNHLPREHRTAFPNFNEDRDTIPWVSSGKMPWPIPPYSTSSIREL